MTPASQQTQFIPTPGGIAWIIVSVIELIRSTRLPPSPSQFRTDARQADRAGDPRCRSDAVNVDLIDYH